MLMPLAVLSWFLPSFGVYVMCSGQAPATGGVIDIARTDLFATDHWLSTRVRVEGLMLGMSRKRAVDVLATQHLNFDDDTGQGCPPNSSVCYVLHSGNYTYTGVTVVFDDEGTIEKISIDAYNRAASKDERSASVSQGFLGQTQEVVEHYSDFTRLRVLGSAEKHSVELVQPPRKLLRSRPDDRTMTAHHQYSYIHRGLILHVYLSGWDALRGQGRLDKLVLEFAPRVEQ